MATSFRCRSCHRLTPWDAPVWRCACGGMLDPLGERWFDPASIETADGSLWRYRHALPEVEPVTLGEGWTPLLPGTLGTRRVWLKLDYVMPSASFKDRGATLQVSRLKQLGIDDVVEDSSGNAGSALAVYCARAGLRCAIYCPEATSPAKTAMIEDVGATVVRVPGPRHAAAEAVMEAAAERYYASHVWDPTYPIGTQTLAFELAEQRGWHAPDAVVVPIGNGSLVLGLAHGFRRLLEAGVIDRLPRLIGAQAAACAPVLRAFEGHEPSVEPEPTLAEGVAVARPPRAQPIVAALRYTHGWVTAVDEPAIVAALEALQQNGCYIEATAAVAPAAATLLLQSGELTGEVVVVLTGSGLKSR